MAHAQLFNIRQLVQTPKPKMIQEKLRSFVKQWTPWDFGAPRNFNEAALHQCLKHTINVDSSNRFDICADDRLAIRDNREGLQRRRTQPSRSWRRKKLSHPLRVFRVGNQLPAVCLFVNLKCPLLLDTLDFQLLEC